MASENRRRSQRGAAGMVELGIALPIFFTLLFGIVTYGHAMFADTQVSYAARAAARWASVRGSSSSTPATSATVQTYVRSKAKGLVANNLLVTTTWSPNNQAGSNVTVDVSYSMTPIVKGIFGNALALRGKSTQVIIR